jgi:YjbE family integral membrane protein
LFSTADLGAEAVALAQVLIIDLVLAGDNAIVVGLAVNGLAPEQRRRAIFFGVAAATGLRIVFALVTLQLLAIVGLLLAGGLLLLWVCWRMYRELRRSQHDHADKVVAPKTLGAAMLQIILADLSMSLDNVLAIAGAAREHPWVLVFGLSISVVLMGAAASLVARLLDSYRWLAWIGLFIVLYISGKMIWEGVHEIAHAMT